MLPPPNSRRPAAFTLVELLTVIAIIAVLMGILFPTISAAIENAKKVQAKSDEQGIITAIKGYYAEYGRYPLADTVTTDYAFGGSASGQQEDLMNVLRFPYKGTTTPPSDVEKLNPRKLSFLEVPNAKNIDKPVAQQRQGISTTGKWLDPWGNEYVIFVDGDYDGSVKNPGYTNAGPSDLSTGVIVYTFGRDGVQGKKESGSGNKDFKGSDDVLSWQ